ncbi:MAG: DUF4136 domain-containing protein [Cyclobacteriaceae bacterium]
MFGVGLTVVTLLASRYPDSPVFVDELDIVVTIRPDVSLKGYNDYFMPDTVIYIGDRGDELSLIDERRILSLVNDNLQSYGWQKEADPEENGSDVLVFVTVLNNSQSGVIWWDWWGWWPGWGYPCYPGYPGYPGWGGGAVYSYEVGTILIEMIDPAQSADGDNESYLFLWEAAMNGLIQGSNVETRYTDGINQAFDDSPYLAR